MESSIEWNEFHDRETHAVRLSKRDVELYVQFDSATKVIRFKGVSRCKLDDFLVKIVIYTITIVDQIKTPDVYDQAREMLPPLPYLSLSDYQKLAKIGSSVGLAGILEFATLEVANA